MSRKSCKVDKPRPFLHFYNKRQRIRDVLTINFPFVDVSYFLTQNDFGLKFLKLPRKKKFKWIKPQAYGIKVISSSEQNTRDRCWLNFVLDLSHGAVNRFLKGLWAKLRYSSRPSIHIKNWLLSCYSSLRRLSVVSHISHISSGWPKSDSIGWTY